MARPAAGGPGAQQIDLAGGRPAALTRPEHRWTSRQRRRPTAVAHGAGQQAAPDQQAAPAARARRTDGFAVATLISGIVPAVPLTVFLGPVALIRISRTRARGRSLAITGLALAGLWTIAAAIGGAVYLTQHHQPPKPAALPRVFSLHTGQCADAGRNG